MSQNVSHVNKKRWVIVALFIILVPVSLMVGAFYITPAQLFAGDEVALTVFLSSRVPRTAAVIVSAAGLSVAGLLMQAISRNKFMSPATSGATDAAAFGMLLSMIFLGGQHVAVQLLLSFVFALVATILFTSVINRLKIREVVYIPLLGMMYGGVIAAVSATVAFHFQAGQLVSAISLASFSRLGSFQMVYIVVIPLIFSVLYATKFSIIGMGEDFAKNLGLKYNRVVFLGIVIVAMISAATFVSVGPLPFIGLIIPNMATSFYGDNLKKSIVDLMLFGAVFVLACDILGRLIIHPFEINITLTISVIGGAIFMVYLLRSMYAKT